MVICHKLGACFFIENRSYEFKNHHYTQLKVGANANTCPTTAYIPQWLIKCCSKLFFSLPKLCQYTSLQITGSASKIPFVSSPPSKVKQLGNIFQAHMPRMHTERSGCVNLRCDGDTLQSVYAFRRAKDFQWIFGLQNVRRIYLAKELTKGI